MIIKYTCSFVIIQKNILLGGIKMITIININWVWFRWKSVIYQNFKIRYHLGFNFYLTMKMKGNCWFTLPNGFIALKPLSVHKCDFLKIVNYSTKIVNKIKLRPHLTIILYNTANYVEVHLENITNTILVSIL